MKALDIKLWRDLWLMKGQALAIVLVIVSGVATFVMFISVMHSLNVTRDTFYRDFAFAEVFGSLKRAPESLKERIREIPGVNLVETRVAADVKLDIKGFNEPVSHSPAHAGSQARGYARTARSGRCCKQHRKQWFRRGSWR
jgi:putative ABC transport system permease protein